MNKSLQSFQVYPMRESREKSQSRRKSMVFSVYKSSVHQSRRRSEHTIAINDMKETEPSRSHDSSSVCQIGRSNRILSPQYSQERSRSNF